MGPDAFLRRAPRSGSPPAFSRFLRLPRGLLNGLLLALLWLAPCRGAEAPADAVRGLPVTRSYPLDEIGYIPRGARLCFDGFGRLAIVHGGTCVVLNDTAWLTLANGAQPGPAMSNLVRAADGRTYFGSRGSWGTAELTADGRLRAVSQVPADAPKWILSASFDNLLATSRGIYFGSPNGIVFRDYAGDRLVRIEAVSGARMFSVGDRVFVSASGAPLSFIDVETGRPESVPGTDFSGSSVEYAAPLDPDHTLLSFFNGHFRVFDGSTLSPWPLEQSLGLAGRVSGMQSLVDGGVAIAFAGKGVYLIAGDRIQGSLTTPKYHRVTALANDEPGVLWLSTEDTVEKVLYRNPLTSFGQQLGLPASWPVVQRWQDRIIVSNSGVLYEAVAGAAGAPWIFQRMKHQPQEEAWAIATTGSELLVGNAHRVYSMEPDSSLVPVGAVPRLDRLVTWGHDRCFAIGPGEIALLERREGRWRESAARIPGITVVGATHVTAEAVWLELGGEGVARLSLLDGRIDLQRIQPPWRDGQWTDVGSVDDIVVLSGAGGQRVFYNDRTRSWCDAPELRRLLDRSPFWIRRVKKDATGTLWATHNNGVVTFVPRDGGYDMDTTSFDLVNDRFPAVQILADNDIWISAGRSLHHVQERGPDAAPVAPAPVLVPVTSNGFGEWEPRPSRERDLGALPFDQSELAFRLFAGTYRWVRAPAYEYRLSGTGRWKGLESGALLTIRGLREGRDLLEVRPSESAGNRRPVASVRFEILPPWYRTWPAFTACGLLVLGAFAGAVRLTGHLQRQRNAHLEKVIHERTRQLEETMEKLNDETRNAATLAERNRLAGEIHDSLQQGLSGAILQLDSTLLLPAITAELRSRLNVVRNMVSFTRHEVQHAVWDMESPLLEGTELGAALQKLTELINSGATRIEVAVTGSPIPLPRAFKHHLLRIAQEATTNAVRHSGAARIAIRLDYTPGSVTLEVSDNGGGFRPDEALSNKLGHFGLRGIRGRVKKLRGEMQLHSTPGEGTTLRVAVPTEAASQETLHAENHAS